MTGKIAYLVVILLFFLLPLAAAAPNDYKITYTINVSSDGTAIWNVEYRTLLVSKEDFDSFENYSKQLNPVYLKGFKELMLNSVSGASNATSRNMAAGGFTGDASVQSAPTGTYGVVRYSFAWTNFARIGPNIEIGDVFIGGLYLSKDDTLVIRYPSGYSVESAVPQPDQERDGLMWYGTRSFGASEPRIVLMKAQSWWVPAVLIILSIAAVALFMARKKSATMENIPGTDMMDLEDRIVRLLKENGNALYQSEIGRRLELPKSTVSAALNELHSRDLIEKVKKGRENLIRLK